MQPFGRELIAVVGQHVERLLSPTLICSEAAAKFKFRSGPVVCQRNRHWLLWVEAVGKRGRAAGGPLPLGDVEKIDADAIWRIELSSEEVLVKFSHGLGRYPKMNSHFADPQVNAPASVPGCDNGAAAAIHSLWCAAARSRRRVASPERLRTCRAWVQSAASDRSRRRARGTRSARTRRPGCRASLVFTSCEAAVCIPTPFDTEQVGARHLCRLGWLAASATPTASRRQPRSDQSLLALLR